MTLGYSFQHSIRLSTLYVTSHFWQARHTLARFKFLTPCLKIFFRSSRKDITPHSHDESLVSGNYQKSSSYPCRSRSCGPLNFMRKKFSPCISVIEFSQFQQACRVSSKYQFQASPNERKWISRRSRKRTLLSLWTLLATNLSDKTLCTPNERQDHHSLFKSAG